MLIRVGDDRTGRIDLALAGIMSFVAGAINAVGFLVAGAFSANMTGNVSGFAEEIASGRIWLALSFAGLVVSFICGAAAAAWTIQIGERRGVRSIYALVILCEALIVLAASAAELLGITEGKQEGLIITLCFVMGLQNAVTTMISHAKVRTTHVSGMATDIGIEIAAVMGDAKGRAVAKPKLTLHSLTLGCFAVGGVLGALVHALIGPWLFAVIGAGLLVVAVPEIWRSHRLAV